MIPNLNVIKEDLMAKGAESEVYSGKYLNFDVVIKHRIEKKYRALAIDTLLRKNRTVQEVRLLLNSRSLGVNVPFVLDIDKSNWIIILEKIDGQTIKRFMDDKDSIESRFEKVGRFMAILHRNNIIHGDLTTSNILLDTVGEIWFIDFGLGYVSPQIEDKAVDILVLKHTLVSSHNSVFNISYNAFLRGYSDYDKYSQVLKRIKQVEDRIRYS